jgi:hypothetical protein
MTALEVLFEIKKQIAALFKLIGILKRDLTMDPINLAMVESSTHLCFNASNNVDLALNRFKPFVKQFEAKGALDAGETSALKSYRELQKTGETLKMKFAKLAPDLTALN